MARSFLTASSQYLSSTSLSGGAFTPLTLAAWVYKTNAAVDTMALTLCTASAYQILRVGFGNDSKLRAQSFDGVTVATSGGVTFSANVWNHCAAVFSSNANRQAWLNGVSDTADTTSLSPAGTPVNVGVGAYYNGSWNVVSDATICELAAWNVALTSNEIKALANGVRPIYVRPSSLLWYHPINGLLNPEPCLVSAGPSLNLNGAPPLANGAPMSRTRRFGFPFSPAAPVTLSPSSLPTAQANTAYNQTITASGGTGPYTFAVTSGTLPAGLTLSPGGVLSGTPTEAAGRGGPKTYSFTVTATDSLGATGSQAY